MKFELKQIKEMIHVVREQKVMLDSDLAQLYQVDTKALNRQVRRNLNRFPADFMFQLSATEYESLKCQFGTSKIGRGGKQKQPLVFTENGVAMLSGILRSERAVEVNIAIMRTFVSLRNISSSYKELEKRVLSIEEKSDDNYKVLLSALLQLKGKIEPSLKKERRKIGINKK